MRNKMKCVLRNFLPKNTSTLLFKIRLSCSLLLLYDSSYATKRLKILLRKQNIPTSSRITKFRTNADCFQSPFLTKSGLLKSRCYVDVYCNNAFQLLTIRVHYKCSMSLLFFSASFNNVFVSVWHCYYTTFTVCVSDYVFSFFPPTEVNFHHYCCLYCW